MRSPSTERAHEARALGRPWRKASLKASLEEFLEAHTRAGEGESDGESDECARSAGHAASERARRHAQVGREVEGVLSEGQTASSVRTYSCTVGQAGLRRGLLIAICMTHDV